MRPLCIGRVKTVTQGDEQPSHPFISRVCFCVTDPEDRPGHDPVDLLVVHRGSDPHARPTARQIAIMIRPLLAALATTLLLAGCGLRERFQSAEDRINRLVPPALAIRHATERIELLPDAEKGRIEKLKTQLQQRLKLRALNCARDVAPRWQDSDAALRARLTDKACFSTADAEITRWLGFVRIGWILEQKPLRPIPARAGDSIPVPGSISSMSFASGAGVVVINARGGLSAVDIGTGDRIWHEDVDYGAGVPMVSPNGRLFLGQHKGLASIRATEGGEVLMAFEADQGFAWVDSRFLVMIDARKDTITLVDLVSGRETPIEGVRHGSSQYAVTLPVEGQPDRFVLFIRGSAYLVGITSDEGRFEARALSQRSGVMTWGTMNTTAITVDGKTALEQSHSLSFLNLEDLALTTEALAPIQVVQALPTSKPDEVLVTLAWPGGANGTLTIRQFVYSRSARTLAAVEGALPDGGRLVWMTPLKSLGRIADGGIKPIVTPAAGAAQAIGDVVTAALDEVNQRKIERLEKQLAAKAAEAVSPAVRASTFERPAFGDALLGRLASEASVQGIGVYQAGRGVVSGSGVRAPGVIDVHVKRGRLPLVLVLSSYEPVQWNILPEPGAQIAAVLLGGYHESTANGAGSARVVRVPREYAFEMQGEKYGRLQATVTRMLGRPMSRFQSQYEGSKFSVDGY